VKKKRVQGKQKFEQLSSKQKNLSP